MSQIEGIFGTLQLNGSITDPICYIHVQTIPPPGTIVGVTGNPPSYYKVIQTMLIVKPLNEMTLAAMLERAEASGEKPDARSNQCVIFVEPYEPVPIEGS